MFNRFILFLGRVFLNKFFTYFHALNILFSIFTSIFNFKIFNKAIFRVFIRQIYFTAVQSIFPMFVSALILGGIVVNYILKILINLNSYDRIGEFIVISVFYELAPIVVSLIILIRSSTAVISEISLMKLNGELDSLAILGIPIKEYIYLPRVLAFLISFPFLNFFFIFVSLIGGYLMLGFLYGINYENYINLIIDYLSLKDFIIVFSKSILLSFLLSLVSIQKGVTVKSSITEVPINLIDGMMSILLGIVIIDILFNLI